MTDRISDALIREIETFQRQRGTNGNLSPISS